MNLNRQPKRPYALIAASFIAISVLLTSCGGAQTRETYTVGMVSYSPPLNPVLEGFKAGMTDLGYVEGENITYIYNGIVEAEAIDAEIESLLAQDVDLLFVMAPCQHYEPKRPSRERTFPLSFPRSSIQSEKESWKVSAIRVAT